MNNIELRQWAQLNYYDPEFILKRLREIGLNYQNYPIDPAIRNLRTNKLKPEREGRQAALFCYGMGIFLNRKIWFSPFESSDYDFVAFCEDEEIPKYIPVQLKELVPETTNSNNDLNEIISSLKKYNSPQLTVAIYLNRTTRVEFENIKCEGLNIAELWLFGSTTENQSSWLLYGDLLNNPSVTKYSYPK